MDNASLSSILSLPGSEMKFTTGMLIFSLENEALYTVSQAVLSRYNDSHPRYEQMCSRISSFVHNQGMNRRRDAKVGNASAWYGKTFKNALNDKTYYRALLHLDLLKDLNKIAEQKEEQEIRVLILQEDLIEARRLAEIARKKAKSAPAPEKQRLEEEYQSLSRLVTEIDEDLDRNSSRISPFALISDSKTPTSRPIPTGNEPQKKITLQQGNRRQEIDKPKINGKLILRISWITALLSLAIVGAFGLLSLLPLEDKGRPPIAVLNCYNNNYAGAVIRDMVVHALEKTDTFTPLPIHRIENQIGPISICEPLSDTTALKFFEDLNVRYLLWGVVEAEGRGYRWSGTLRREDGEKRSIKVAGNNYQTLADNIARKCLKLLGSDETPPSSAGPYSPNLFASFLYSEANVHFGNGNIIAASAEYERAATVYDPDFYMARNNWARCLELQGDLPKARSVLETILTEENVEIPVLFQTLKNLVSVYYENRDIEGLESLLARADDLHFQEKDSLFFMNARARLFLLRENNEAAEAEMEKALGLARKLDQPKGLIDTLWTAAWVWVQGDETEKALGLLSSALEMAREYDLPSREATVLGEKARVLLKLKDKERIEKLIGELNEAQSLAYHSGNAVDRVKIRYWLGFCYGALGQWEQEYKFLYKAAEEALQLGILEYELKAKYRMMRYLLKKNDILEAERIAEPLMARFDTLAPKYKLLLLESVYYINLGQEAYEETLARMDLRYQIALEVGNQNEMAWSLLARGWALYRLDRPDQAETAYLESLELESQHKPLILKNLIQLYREQGRKKEAQLYEEALQALE